MDEFEEVRNMLGFIVDAGTVAFFVYRGARLVWAKLPQGEYDRDIRVTIPDNLAISDSTTLYGTAKTVPRSGSHAVGTLTRKADPDKLLSSVEELAGWYLRLRFS